MSVLTLISVLDCEGVFSKTDEAAITEALSWDRKFLELLVNARQTSKLSTWTDQQVHLKKDIGRMCTPQESRLVRESYQKPK